MGKDPAKPKAPEITAVPDIRDKEGNLLKLKGNDFPKTKDGKLAYCDYQIEKINVKKVDIESNYHPEKKKMKKIERLKAQLLKLEEELKTE